MRQELQTNRKRKFKVYVTATVGTCIEVMAKDSDEVEAIAENRWETGKGGAIEYEDMEATDVHFSACEERGV